MPYALSNPNLIILILLAMVPSLLWLTGGGLHFVSDKRTHQVARLSVAVAGTSFIGAIVAAMVYAVGGTTLTMTFGSVVLPGNRGDLALSLYINPVTMIMLLLVSFVGFVVSRYARNYLQGEKHQKQFYVWLNLTLASILTLIVSGNMLMFVVAWMSTSFCLHHLLLFYPERMGAVLAARKKIIVSRVGEVCLLIAVLLIGSTFHSMDFDVVFQDASRMSGPFPVDLYWASGLIVLAAALKTAQFPLQGWLIQVMEAPTPVSALLHAGIVNGGAFLILRMSPIMSKATVASDVLAIIGLITIVAAGLVMLTQTSVKVFLAWTTTAQMGFMLLECGLGVYSLVMLHLVAHSLYKAHAFLSSGSMVDVFRAPTVRPAQSTPKFWQWVAVLIFSGVATLCIGAIFGIAPESQPALLSFGAIIVVAMMQLLLQSLKAGVGMAFIARAGGVSALVCAGYFSLHGVFHWMLATTLPVLPVTNSPAQFVLSGLVILAFFIILLIQQNLPNLTQYGFARRAYVHLYNGLYVDIPFSRLVQRCWSIKPVRCVPPPKGV